MQRPQPGFGLLQPLVWRIGCVVAAARHLDFLNAAF